MSELHGQAKVFEALVRICSATPPLQSIMRPCSHLANRSENLLEGIGRFWQAHNVYS